MFYIHRITAITCLLLLPCFVLAADRAGTEGSPVFASLPKKCQTELEYLLSMIPGDGESLFSPEKMDATFDLLRKGTGAPQHYAGKTSSISYAYQSFEIEKPLVQVIAYMYNPDIPAVVFSPSAIRLSYWSEVDGKKQPLPPLWKNLKTLQSPLFIRGVEHVEITPDSSSGAYYVYDHDRLLILGKKDGNNFLINIYKQKAPSTVGKKGVVLGSDEDWNYLYSGQKGISTMGLGWAQTYIYESYGVTLLLEEKNAPGRIRGASVAWLSAGWAHINMVNSGHIYAGIERFTEGLKTVMEHPDLPEPDRLAAQFQQYRNNSRLQLKMFAKNYFSALADRYRSPENFPEKLSQLITSEPYIDTMTYRELKALFDLEYTKYIIGKPGLVDINAFLLQAQKNDGHSYATFEN